MKSAFPRAHEDSRKEPQVAGDSNVSRTGDSRKMGAERIFVQDGGPGKRGGP